MRSLMLSLALLALPAAAAADEPATIWRSEGYGYLVAAGPSGVRLFEEHRAGCVLTDTFSTREEAGSFMGHPTGAPVRGRVIMRRGPTEIAFRMVRTLPRACRTPLATNDPRINFDVFTETLSDYYPFFAQHGVDWRRAVAQARRRVRALPRDGDIFPILTDLVAPLNDGHISIEAGERRFHLDALRAPGTAPDGQPWTWRSLRTSFRDFLVSSETPLTAPAEMAGANRVMHGWLPGDVGYIAFMTMGGFDANLDDEATVSEEVAATSALMDSLLERYGAARGIVIDLRVNSGGYDAVAMEIASRFAAAPVLAFRKQAQGQRGPTPLYDVRLEPSAHRRFTGPVAVLIGGDTISGGETAALAFAALPNATLIGANTRGMFSDAIPKRLPNGWTYTLSVEIARSPAGAILEGVGVAPDISTTIAPTASPNDRFGADIRRAQDLIADSHRTPRDTTSSDASRPAR